MKIVKKMVLVFLLLLLCSLGSVAAARSPKESTEAYAAAVRSYFDQMYPFEAATEYIIAYDAKADPWLELQVPDAQLVQAYARFRIPPVTGTFIFWKGRAYVMPDEFNDFTKDAHIRVLSEEDAIGLAGLYAKAWEPSGDQDLPAAMVIAGVDEISQKVNRVPSGKGAGIKPPAVGRKPDGYEVVFWTWSSMGGWLREWDLEVSRKGEVTGTNTLVGENLGDATLEGATPVHVAFGADGAGTAAGSEPCATSGDVHHTQDVVIGSDTRFVIHWCEQDFQPTGTSLTPDGTPTQVVAWIDAAARNAWQTLIVNYGFNQPPDGTIDIFIWNDSVSWGPAHSDPGVGAYYNIVGSEQYIYALNNGQGWFNRNPYWSYWPTYQDAQNALVGHEFLHSIQEGYGVLGCSQWVYEGTARFSQTLLTWDGEMWQNSALVALGPGPFVQDDAHRGHYIKDSTIYLRAPGDSLSGWSYKACTFWRYTFEHGSGIADIQAVYGKVKTDGNCGSSFADQVGKVNAALGTTDMRFSDFAAANYLEFSPWGFARDNEFYRRSDRYYADVARTNENGPYTQTITSSVFSYATRYYDIDPGSIRHFKLSFNGDNAGSFAVKAFRGQGTTATTLPFTLDTANDGSITIHDADTADVIGLMVAGLDTAATRSFTLKLEDVNTPPVAEAGGPYAGQEGSAITLDASASSDADGDPLQYRWDVNSDATWEIPWTTDATVDYTFGDDFSGTTTLEVSDGGETAQDTAGVTITNVNPEAHAGPDATINEGSTFTRAGSFTDPGADTWTATVNYDDGNGVETLPLTGKTFTLSHTYADNRAGNAPYTVTVTVTDDDGGSGTDEVLVTVLNVNPSVTDLTLSQPNQHFILPVVDTVTFTGIFTDPGWLDTHTATWDFDDGSPAVAGTVTEENLQPDATGSSVQGHAFPAPGGYTVTLTITDKDGGTGIRSLAVHVASLEEAKHILAAYIQGLPESSFKGKADQRKGALDGKFQALDAMITGEEWNGFIMSLQNDIRAKADGHVDGKPSDDWINEKDAQEDVCGMVDEIVAYAETLL